MGDIKGMLGMIPGISKMKKQIEQSGISDNLITKQEAILLSMTIDERKRPNIIKASRKRRIANGSGTNVQDVNKILKQYQQMAGMMKKAKKLKKKGLLPSFDSSLMGAGDAGELADMLPSDFSPNNLTAEKSFSGNFNLGKGFSGKFKP